MSLKECGIDDEVETFLVRNATWLSALSGGDDHRGGGSEGMHTPRRRRTALESVVEKLGEEVKESGD